MNRIVMRVALAATAAAVLAVEAPKSAAAHEYFAGGSFPIPEGLDGFRHLYISVGSTVALTVKNGPKQSCKANIALSGNGPEISVTSPGPSGAVLTRVFNITGKTAGSTSFNIAVQGIDPCTEDSTNPFEVVVLPSDMAPLKSLTLAVKNENKLLGLGLKMEYTTLRTTTTGILADMQSGTTPPNTAALSITNAWYGAWMNGFTRGQTTLHNVSNYGMTLLTSGGWPECQGPIGFTDGAGGPYDLIRSSVRSQLDGYWGKLDKQIDADIGAYRKIGSGLDIGFQLSYDLRHFPDLAVTGPTTSPNPADPPMPLYTGYSGALTYSTPFVTATCVGFAGISDPLKGQVKCNLFDGTGLVGTKTFSPNGSGLWNVMFDNLKAGKTYRSELTYTGGGGGYDTTRISSLGLRSQF